MALAPTDVFDVFKRGTLALKELDASFCLVGGLARGFYAEARSTKDVDFAIAAESDERINEIVRGLWAAGFRDREMFFHKETKALWTARFTLGDDETRMDLLFATSGIESAVVRDAIEKRIDGTFSLPVIARPHFIAMKCIAGRPHDMSDVAALLSGATRADKRMVSSLIRLAPDAKRARGLKMWALAQQLEREYEPDFVEATPVRRSSKKRR